MGTTNDFIQRMAQDWDGYTAHERNEIIMGEAERSGLSISTLYRKIKKERGKREKTIKHPKNKGIPKNMTKEEQIISLQNIMALKALDPKKPNKRVQETNKVISTARAIEILENCGKIEKGKLNDRIVNRSARQEGLTVKDICRPRPAIRLVSLYPNHVHQVDFTVCNQYYLRESDGKISTRPWTYKNKPNESREKIWAFGLVDHYSGVKFIKYFLSPGENVGILYDGLMEAWGKKNDTQFPFHGAPAMLYADKGAPFNAERIKNLLKALNIKLEQHKPGNPRAKGMVEKTFKDLQQGFETELRIRPASTLQELNERSYNYLLKTNWEKKSGEAKPRFAMWQDITEKQLLILPPEHILQRVTASSDIRTVDAYSTISLNNEKIGVPAELMGRKIRIWHSIDGGMKVQDIATGELYPTIEEKTAVFGTFNRHKMTDADRLQEEALEMADELRKQITPEMLLRDVPNIHALPRTGTPIEVDSDLVKVESDCYESLFAAKTAIADEIGISLSELPEWIIEEINKALEVTLNKEKVYEIARLISGEIDEAKVV